MRAQNRTIKGVDWFTVLLYLFMVGFGWVNIYAVNTDPDTLVFFDYSKEYTKQIVWIGVSFVTIGVIMLTDSKFFVEFSYVFYAITTFLLILVIFIGVEINAAKAWFQIGGMRFQPVELAKVATALAVARVMCRFQFSFYNISDILRLGTLIFLPILIIIIQNDTGSGIVLLALFIAFFREGLSPYVFVFGFVAIAVFILTMIIPNHSIILILSVAFILMVLFNRFRKEALIMTAISVVFFGVGAAIFKTAGGGVNYDVALLIAMAASSIFLAIKALLRRLPKLGVLLIFFWGTVAFTYSTDYVFEEMLGEYQRNRILVMLGLKDDPLGVGYNVNQSKIAIGSGGLLGKGFLQGTQTKFNFVPEQSTDFIFCTVGEEWGFLGTSIVVLLFVILLLRLIFLAERQHSDFSRIYGYGVASIFFFHVAVNIGMTIGLAPVIGIPLPFFSYGGSSLWGFTILLFIFLKLDTNRTQLLR
ncbi:rod shape-determining protein RodA [Alkalitalea saponilacus]|uniref:Cell wall polymerase n=1 Tax=Alkalitalea saponilacus TaxID=889453 RepID=A0A1T5A4Y7_9BACT|nr:rod shape-determining protein RodA [Alkalitalea saponilacus]ASB48849.1 rod shape-determining protein RodA [Alkalitalea saponilacus]SKB29965.1 rod shape determining protein RodA [Alkalitalea saponilacus]